METRTKIVTTLGPNTEDPKVLRALLEAGADVVRVNASHGDHRTHGAAISAVREQAAQLGRPVGILYDLQGPKIRIGAFDGDPVPIRAGEIFTLAVGRAAQAGELPTDYESLHDDVSPGEPLLIDDGTLASEVVEVEPGTVRCRALNHGAIGPRKGINLPETDVSTPAISDKDRSDAMFALSRGVDLIALSFVRRPEDVEELNALIAEAGHDTPVISKIEKPQALNRLDEILEVSWGVMVARGDLGVELATEEVPMAQKRIIREARALGRPVITATQMLDSMKHSIRPTRAEASDVANAVLDGTDAVMLSGETAVGEYPVESVQTMRKIVSATERGEPLPPTARRRERGIDHTPEAVTDACCQVAHHLEATALVAFTQTGRTAVLMSQRRPHTPVLAFTPAESVCRRLALAWGVRSFRVEHSDTLEARIERLDAALRAEKLAADGDRVVISMGAPMAPEGSTNLMMVHRVGQGPMA